MKRNYKTELLAPAKDKQTALSAIDCGADAVYIGANAFGARKNAPNSLEDIKEVVNYAHKFWAKVFVTMNTILTDDELNEAVEIAKILSDIGVDALIIQDMGFLNKLIELKLPIPIHASTQCDNYLPQKVRFLNNIGLSRVILARELSIEQIKNIHKENPNLELETFVHGALCVSMSGQCYLSQSIGGRSANRGECAQPCRKKYTVKTSDGEIVKKDFYALCLKDFNASNCLEELISAGVYSFKIEGRLKDENYVKNVVSYYRQKLGKASSSGRSIYPFEPNPEKSFNRGFTEYFLKGRTDCFNQESPKSKGEYLGKIIEVKNNCFKIKTKREIHAQDGIYLKGDGFKVNKFDKGYIYPNREINVKIGDEVWRNFDSEFESELIKPVKRQIGLSVSVKNGKIILVDEDNVTLEFSLVSGEKAKNPDKMRETFVKQFSKTGESDFYIEDIKIDSEIPFLPVSEINQLRRDLFEQLMKKRVKTYNEQIKQTQKEMKYVEYFEKEVDYRANIHNLSAKEFYEKCGVKVLEFSFEKTGSSKNIAFMRCKHCIKYALNMCKSPKNLILQDEYGKTYQLKFDCKNCEMTISKRL